MLVKSILLLPLGILLGGLTAFGQCQEPFFSEYIEGSSNNKGIEIYNPTGADLDLSDYQVYLAGNGGSGPFSNFFNLSGIVAPGDVYTIVTDQADPAMQAVADTALAFPSVVHFNGDDAVVLVKLSTSDTVDVIGVIGVDPGSNWPVDIGSTQEYTLVRKPDVHQGTTIWSGVGDTQWLVYPQNTFSYLGSHSKDLCPYVSNCKTDLFFSEYIEGSGNNKGIEIFNPGDTTVDLSKYQIFEAGNGGSGPFTDVFNLGGTLDPGEVYVIVTDQADLTMQAVADTILAFPSVSHFNGDDALAIVKLNTLDTIDVIGEIGVDPGSSWPVDTGSTQNFTLVRKPTVNKGTTSWTLGATQWIVLPINTFDSLGTHTMNPCSGMVVDSPLVSISPLSASESEGSDSAFFSVNIFDSDTNVLTVDVVLDSAATTATPGVDFNWSDTTLTFPASASSSIKLGIELLDDAEVESDEMVVLQLTNVSDGGRIGSSTFTLTIIDNDYAAYPIGLVTDDADGDGLGDSLGVKCELQGIVHGVDIQGGSSIKFTIIDTTDGISVFSNNDFGYSVLEGDEVIIRGSVGQYNGLTEFSPDTIILVSQGNPTATPLVVDSLGEYTESELIILECVRIIDPSSWPAESNNGFVDVTNNVDTFLVFIDRDGEIDGTSIPTGKWLNITGIGGQFDGSAPYTEGYQLLPRYVADFSARPDPVVTFDNSDGLVRESDGSTTVNLSISDSNPDTTWVTIVAVDSISTASDATDYLFPDTTIYFVGCGVDSVSLPLTIVSDSEVEANETLVLIISTVSNNASTATDTLEITITEWADAIGDILPPNAIKLFPNPASQTISWESDHRIERLVIMNLMGQEMLKKLNPAQSDQINIGTLPNGVYLMRINTDEGLWIQKWIKR